MTTVVDICNLALSNIRAGGINSLTEGSLQAQQCALKYLFVRDKILSETQWGFNNRTKPLALLTDDIFNWVYAYQYPSDCLYIDRLILNIEENSSTTAAIRTRQIEDVYEPDLDRQVKYEVMVVEDANNPGTFNKIIVSNEAELRVRYRVRVEDPNLYGVSVVIAMGHLLAAEVVIPIVGVDSGTSLQKTEYQLYLQHLASAISTTKNEQYEEPVESDFITVRN